MLNSITYSLPRELEESLRKEVSASEASNKISRIWNRDASVWSGEDESKWLGWLDIVSEETNNLETYKKFGEDVRANFKSILLMGMGGSSLAPEVLAMTFEKSNFRILDSTVPAQVKTLENSLDLMNTLFIVSSKSGSTLEPNCFKQYFFDRVSQAAGKENAGKQFVAITDPGSKMEGIAKRDGFRYVFHGNPQIGGRFSALSAFGLGAAASMGLDVGDLLYRSQEMVDACRSHRIEDNPGALLGSILGVCQTHGRDKVTIFTSPEIHDLGAWLEQLLAESTGKNGVAIIPVDREPVIAAEKYSNDRVFVFLTVKGIPNEPFANAVEAGGHPVIKIELESTENIGQEFFRWEFATAVAGSIMKINTFNQPDVEAAKIEARKLTDEYEKAGELPDETPFFEDGAIQLFTGPDYLGKLATKQDSSLDAILNTHIRNIGEGDYFALLAYIQMNPDNETKLQAIRKRVLERNGNATCLGFGPRFLHSTGQAYKGGPNTGVFLQITADDEFDLPVPGQKYTFGVVKTAQARGDFQVLLDRGRRALRIHIKGSLSDGLDRVFDSI